MRYLKPEEDRLESVIIMLERYVDRDGMSVTEAVAKVYNLLLKEEETEI